MPNVLASQLSSDTTSSEFMAHGKTKLGNREYAESVRFFSKALQLNPSSSIAYRYKGDAEKMLKKYEESIKSYSQSLHINPNDTLALVGRADANRLAGKLDDALVDFQAVIQLTPNDTKLYFGRGSVLLQLEKYKEALPDYTVSISAFPAVKVLLYDRAVIYFNLNNYKDAIIDLKNYLRHVSESPLSAFYLLGLSYQRLHQVDSAIKYFNSEIAVNPSDADSYMALAVCYSQKMDSVKANSLFGKVNELEYKTADFFTNRAAVELNFKHYERAMKYLIQAKELGAASEEYYNNLGNAQLGMKDTTSSIESLSKSISINPTFRLAYASRMSIYMNKYATLKLAIRDLSAIINLENHDNRNYVNFFLRSFCFARLKEADSARLDLQRAFSVAPPNAYSYAMRALVNMFLDEQPEKIIADLSQAIKLQNSYWEAYVLRAEQYAELGQHKKACLDVKKAVELGAQLTQEIKDYLCKGTLKNGKPPSINVKLTPPL